MSHLDSINWSELNTTQCVWFATRTMRHEWVSFWLNTKTRPFVGERVAGVTNHTHIVLHLRGYPISHKALFFSPRGSTTNLGFASFFFSFLNRKTNASFALRGRWISREQQDETKEEEAKSAFHQGTDVRTGASISPTTLPVGTGARALG